MNRLLTYMLFMIALVIQGCASLDPASRNEHADKLASQFGWTKKILKTDFFSHKLYFSDQKISSRLVIYLEGDGLAWINKNTPSSNPTPLNPVALQLALQDPRGAVFYLGRPCQYVQSPACTQKYWTSDRFAPEVIASIDQAISLLVAETQAQEVELIGYSGGGGVAALVAARRDDVVMLVTIAGNLDHKEWTTLHTVSALTGSLNPADYWRLLMDTPQRHYVGAEDTIMPPAVAASFQRRFPVGHKPEIKIIKLANHHCCWIEQWPDLLNEAL